MISRSTFAGHPRIEAADVERDDRAVAAFGQSRDEAVADLAAGAGDEDDRFTHAANYT